MKRLIQIFSKVLAKTIGAFRFFRSSHISVAGVPVWRKARQESRKTRTKQRLLKVAAIGIVLAAGGFLVAASGIIPIKASSGHWAITRWFLNFSMKRSVLTHTLGNQAPPLDDAALILKGAGHYEIGCFPCHGSPVLREPRITRRMTPRPPYLPEVLHEWKPDDLFYIVKHGVKFTGMPAWPALQRDDEVWAVVAFLLTLPGLDAEEYMQYTRGSAAGGNEAPISSLAPEDDVPAAVTDNCGRCHGIDGLGRGTGAFPKLAGQRPTYLYAALQAYARGERNSGIMEPLAAGLSPDDMRELARYYANLQGLSNAPDLQTVSMPSIERGREIANTGIPKLRVPSCVDCHGPNPTRRNPSYPLLAGQYADYIVLQLQLFQKKIRGGSAYEHLMHPVASRLTEEEMANVAQFYESLSP